MEKDCCFTFCLFLSCMSLLAYEGLAQSVIQPLSSVQPINAGEQINLDCTITNTNEEAEVEWYHDGDVISYGSSILRDREQGYTLEVMQDSDTSTTYHWIIRIANVNVLRDRGQWSCRFEGGEVVTELLQIGPPSITTVTPNLNEPTLNSDVRLECLASGVPVPSVTWSRTYPVPYIMVNGARKGFIRDTYNNTIRLNPLTNDHRGEYMCSVTNGHGDTLTRKTYVRLPYMPEVKATIKNMRVTLNSEAVLACISQAYPATSSESNVVWTVDGTAVDLQSSNVDVDRHPDNFYDERYYSRLTIRSMKSSDVGTYMCTFDNGVGVASDTVNLGLEPNVDFNFGAKTEL